MTSIYDIFKVAGDGERVWLEAVQNLDMAMRRANALQKNFPGEYVLISQSTGKTIRITAGGGVHRS